MSVKARLDRLEKRSSPDRKPVFVIVGPGQNEDKLIRERFGEDVPDRILVVRCQIPEPRPLSETGSG